MQMLGSLGAKRNLYFIYFALLLFIKTFPRHWANGGTRVGTQALGAHQHITQLFKNVFLRISLDQNMPKNVCFLEKAGSAPEPPFVSDSWIPQTSAY